MHRQDGRQEIGRRTLLCLPRAPHLQPFSSQAMPGVRCSIRSSWPTRASRMSGEALTTASLTMDLVLQFLGRHLHDGNMSMRKFVDEICTTRARDLGRLRL